MPSPQLRNTVLTTSNLQKHTTTTAIETPRTKVMRYFNQVTAETTEDISLLPETRLASPANQESVSPWDPTRDFLPGLYTLLSRVDRVGRMGASPILGQKVPRTTPSPIVIAARYNVFASEDSDILLPNRNKPNIIPVKRAREVDDIDSELNYSWEQTPERPSNKRQQEIKGPSSAL